MHFQVPEFVDVEDKTVGPLTLKQFLYVAAAFGLSMLLFFVVSLWLWFVLSVFLVGGAAALSMVKINGQPLVKIAIAAIGFYWRPQTYVWQSEKQKTKGAESPLEKFRQGFSLEKIVSGLALRKSWQNLQTGVKAPTSEGMWKAKRGEERYEIVKKITGDRKAERRV